MEMESLDIIWKSGGILRWTPPTLSGELRFLFIDGSYTLIMLPSYCIKIL